MMQPRCAVCDGDNDVMTLCDAHLTLREVANGSGVTISFLSDIERGRTLPSLDTLERIAEVYNLSIGGLLVNVRIRPETDQ